MKTGTGKNNNKLHLLVEGALMVALSFVLSLIPLPSMPLGGTITLASTLPLLLMSIRHGAKWGVVTSSVYAFLQALLGVSNILICKTVGAMLLCALLDYYLAYAVLGTAALFFKLFKNPYAGISVAILATGAFRLASSFLSGIILWGEYAAEGMQVWQHSIIYNASWLVPDVIIVLAAALVMYKIAPQIFTHK